MNAPEQVAERQSALRRLETELAVEVRRRSDFALAREILQARSSEATSATQSLDAERTRAERITLLDAKRADAAALEAAVASLAENLNSDAATPARIDRLRALAHARDLANAELRGETASVDIALEPGGEGRVRIDGAIVTGPERCEVPEHLVIAIDGIATIRVTAAGAEQAAAARITRDTSDAEIAEVLAAIGAGSIDDARERAARAQWPGRRARSRAGQTLRRRAARLGRYCGRTCAPRRDRARSRQIWQR